MGITKPVEIPNQVRDDITRIIGQEFNNKPYPSLRLRTMIFLPETAMPSSANLA